MDQWTARGRKAERVDECECAGASRLLVLIEAVYATVPDDAAWACALVPAGAAGFDAPGVVEVADPATGECVGYDLARLLDDPTPVDAATCARVVPHLARALALRACSAAFLVRVDALLQAVERLPFGLLLLDGGGRPTDLSVPAGRILRDADGLQLVDGVLTATHPQDAGALAKAIELASQPRGREWRPDLVVRVARSGASPWLVSCAPLRRSGVMPTPDGHPACAVFVHDPMRAVQPPGALLQRALGITAGEADLVGLLASGVELAAAADRLGIPHETARSRLKSIFRKTGCRRQIDLMRLVVAGPAGAWHDGEPAGPVPTPAAPSA